MTKLQVGKLYISKEDILNYMNLTDDTHLEFEVKNGDIEINVYASSDNKHDWLRENDSSLNNWNVSRVKMELPRKAQIGQIDSAKITFGKYKWDTINSNNNPVNQLLDGLWALISEAIKDQKEIDAESFMKQINDRLKRNKGLI